MTGITAGCAGASVAVCAADCAFAACVWLVAVKGRPLRSAVELGVPLLFGTRAAAASFCKGAELAVRVGDEDGVVWAAPWSWVAAARALVPGAGLEFGRPGDDAVVAPSPAWGVAVLDCSASGGPGALDPLPGLGATVDAGAAVVRTEGEAGAGVGPAEPAATPAPSAAGGAAEVDPAADGELGSPEDVVAGSPEDVAGVEPESAAVVASEAPEPGE